MKRLICVLFVVLILISLCACGAKTPTATQTPSDSPDNSVAVSPSESAAPDGIQSDSVEPQGAVTVEVTPPNGWTPVEGSVLSVQYMKGTASFMVKDEAFATNSLDEVVSQALDMFKTAFEDVTVQGDVETMTIDGKDARKVVFTASVSGITMKYLYVYLFAGGKTYSIVFGDLADTFDALSADYDAILGSIQFNVQ